MHTIPHVEVGDAYRRISEKSPGTLLDVREPEEFADVRAQGARNVPLSWLRGADPTQRRALRLEEPVHVICRSGQRSAMAVLLLNEAGSQSVANVAGGTLAWVRAGLPVDRGLLPVGAPQAWKEPGASL